jgi:uncharacterized membrane protein YgcG
MRKALCSIIIALIASALALVFISASAFAEERVLSYRSDITVNADSSMDVLETIRVTCENVNINHGIYRDFPTRYRDALGNRIIVDFKVTVMKRDGKDEPFHTERYSNGVRVYAGSKDVVLNPGEYEYQIGYHTNRQLGFFADHDELYWNATGNGWDFPIDEATAVVTLPQGVPAGEVKLEAYTGPDGSKGKDYNAFKDKEGRCIFETTRALNASEGMTIVVMFPKGHVTAPTSTTKLWWYFRDNLPAVLAIIGVLFILIYYMDMWGHYGRDPARGLVFPQFKPPLGLSPATLRYVRQMGYDNKAFAATILNLAVKGCLRIGEEKKRKYTLYRDKGKTDGLPPEELGVLEALLPDEGMPLPLDQENYSILQSGISQITKTVGKAVEGKYYVLNSARFGLGVGFSIIVFIASIFAMASTGSVSAWTFLCFILLIALNILFGSLLKAYTPEGRDLLDNIEGFRMYMSVAEEDMPPALDNEMLPEKTPGLFEEYLPYALALGVERAWAEKFAEVFAHLREAGQEYHPGWYDGHSWNSFAPTTFAGAMGSAFSSAISSSSSPPGSSSGGGGGGCSGGGGGGGGGGGW